MFVSNELRTKNVEENNHTIKRLRDFLDEGTSTKTHPWRPGLLKIALSLTLTTWHSSETV